MTRYRIVERLPMRYRRGADPSLDRPAHVRAASGLAWLGDRLVAVQDDAAFLAIVAPATGLCDDVALPTGAGGRRVFDAGLGNKRDKPDLEAVLADGDTLIAFGSGGPIAARRIIVTWRAGAAPRVIAAPRLFEALAAAALPGATALNLEGAALDGDTVVLGNRGGDVAGADVSPDALIRLDLAALRALLDDPDGAPLPPLAVEPLALGALGAAPLHLTDLAPSPRGLLFLAAAEATTTFFDDGEVTGSVVGRLADRRWAPIEGRDKVEGVAVDPRDPDRLLAVTDPDDPARPGELLHLEPC